MMIIDTPLADLKVVQSSPHRDERGTFTRRRAWLPSLGSLWGSNHNGYKMVMLVALVV